MCLRYVAVRCPGYFSRDVVSTISRQCVLATPVRVTVAVLLSSALCCAVFISRTLLTRTLSHDDTVLYSNSAAADVERFHRKAATYCYCIFTAPTYSSHTLRDSIAKRPHIVTAYLLHQLTRHTRPESLYYNITCQSW